MRSKIEILASLEDFFKDELRLAAKKQNLEIDYDVAFYVAQLLTKFSKSSAQLSQVLPNGETSKDPVLALLWLEGLQKNPKEQLIQMRYLGDISLFTTGFFSERIEKFSLDRDYYLAMGEQAYQQAGTLQRILKTDHELKNLFDKLSQSFVKVVSVVEEISLKSKASDKQGLVWLYEKWLKNQDTKIERILQENGVISAKPKIGDQN